MEIAKTARTLGARFSEFLAPVVRLGVTGLARSGKTVFVMALVRNMIASGRLPFFTPVAEGRIKRAYLEPQPDDSVPRFAYEEHLAELAKDPPQWPESTRRVSQLRVTVEYESTQAWRRILLPGRMHIDIVDYPGEWLIDLPLLDCSFAVWSERAVAEAKRQTQVPAAASWVEEWSGQDPDAPADEQIALRGAAAFTRYLEAARLADSASAGTGPGRFLLPGDLQGSPLLTFFPLPARAGGYSHASLGAMLARRYESYKDYVVKPFFRDHFARLDRQIVLVDALSAANAGWRAIEDLEGTLTNVLAAFKPGRNSWLDQILMSRKVDRIVFAATKADHVHHTNHDRLESILRYLTSRAIERAEFAGADVKVLALAALRATREAEAKAGEQRLPCIVGIPQPGERVGGTSFDGRKEAVVFPGDLPTEVSKLSVGDESAALQVVRFRPPRLREKVGDGQTHAWPHIRLDRAMEFLLGDRLR
jgi:predicted YcjX-like family ATPase